MPIPAANSGAGPLPSVTGPEVLAVGDISEAMAVLRTWHSTWVELDERLRTAAG